MTRLDEIEKVVNNMKQTHPQTGAIGWEYGEWLTQRLRICEKELEEIDDDLSMAENPQIDHMAWATHARNKVQDLLKSIRGENGNSNGN